MAKYVFKNAEVEKALRLVAKEFGISNEQFDEAVKVFGNFEKVYFGICHPKIFHFSFSTSLLREIKDFDPNGWNDSDVIPPVDDPIANASTTMLAEDKYGDAKKVFYDFNNHVWREAVYSEIFDCKRYRLYPSD